MRHLLEAQTNDRSVVLPKLRTTTNVPSKATQVKKWDKIGRRTSALSFKNACLRYSWNYFYYLGYTKQFNDLSCNNTLTL